jgi:glycosyltransferase involved in cell wall biosynthesis
MPVRNAAPFVRAAIASVLGQTFGDFEFIIVDDASDDGSEAIIAEEARADARIRAIRRGGGGDLAGALNAGLDAAAGRWIARIDADDEAAPERFARQIERLGREPDLAILGSWIEVFRSDGQPGAVHREPVGPAAVLLHAAVGTPFAHPAVMLRRSFLDEHRLRYHDMPAQDYDLFARILQLGGRGANLPEVLTRYREHAASDSAVRRRAHEEAAEAIALRHLIHVAGTSERIFRWRRPRFREIAHGLLTGNAAAARTGDFLEVNALLRLLASARARFPDGRFDWPGLEAEIAARAQARGGLAPKLGAAATRVLSAVHQDAQGLRQRLRSRALRRNAPAPAAAFLRDVPVFINVRDRLTCLEALVAWLERAGHENIALIDNASTYEPLLAYLRTTPHRVLRLAENLGHTALWRLPELHPVLMTRWYVYTDPDVVPDERAPLDATVRFRDLLSRHPQYLKAGFGLRLDDLPARYRQMDKVLAWERALYGRTVEPGVQEADIDTTFALHRPGLPYCLGPALRTRGDCQARHLPWYVDSGAIDEEEAYYRKHAARDVTTWNVAGVVRETWHGGPGGIAARETLLGYGLQRLRRRFRGLEDRR